MNTVEAGEVCGVFLVFIYGRNDNHLEWRAAKMMTRQSAEEVWVRIYLDTQGG